MIYFHTGSAVDCMVISETRVSLEYNFDICKNILTSLFRNIKYICMKMNAILVAGVRASMMLWHLVFCSSSKY